MRATGAFNAFDSFKIVSVVVVLITPLSIPAMVVLETVDSFASFSCVKPRLILYSLSLFLNPTLCSLLPMLLPKV